MAVEDRREDARAVHPRQRQPLDVPARRDERADLAVRQQAVVGDRRERAAAERDVTVRGLRGSAAPARRCDGCARRRSPSGLLPLPEGVPSLPLTQGSASARSRDDPRRKVPDARHRRAGRIVAPWRPRPTVPPRRRPRPGRPVPGSAAPSSTRPVPARSATLYPDRIAVVHGELRRTYAELAERVNRLGSSLRAERARAARPDRRAVPERSRAARAPSRGAAGGRRARRHQHASEPPRDRVHPRALGRSAAVRRRRARAARRRASRRAGGRAAGGAVRAARRAGRSGRRAVAAARRGGADRDRLHVGHDRAARRASSTPTAAPT